VVKERDGADKGCCDAVVEECGICRARSSTCHVCRHPEPLFKYQVNKEQLLGGSRAAGC
jgi:hypothetical protein